LGIPAGCGGNGNTGRGGDGGMSVTGADARTGGGGGAGLYGGGGGAGYVSDQGGGAGGSSKIPAGGSVGVAPSTDVPASVDIEPYTTTGNSRKSDPTKLLKTMSTQLFFLYFPTNPGSSTRLGAVHLDNVPRGSQVLARCRTRTRKACEGRLRRSLTRRRAGGSLRIRAFEQEYPAGTRLRVVIKNADYITQVMIIEVRRGKGPRLRSRCQAPNTERLKHC